MVSLLNVSKIMEQQEIIIAFSLEFSKEIVKKKLLNFS